MRIRISIRVILVLACAMALALAGCGGGGGGDSSSGNTGTNGGSSFATATALPVDGSKSGEITGATDQDYYIVTTSGEGTVVITVTGLTDDLDVDLFDASQNMIDYSAELLDNPEAVIYTGPAATYYVHIWGIPGDITSPYTVTAYFYASGETIPITVDTNDWYDDADQVPSNTVITSSISGTVDRDNYVITLDAPATINFELTNSTATFGLALYDEIRSCPVR